MHLASVRTNELSHDLYCNSDFRGEIEKKNKSIVLIKRHALSRAMDYAFILIINAFVCSYVTKVAFHEFIMNEYKQL